MIGAGTDRQRGIVRSQPIGTGRRLQSKTIGAGEDAREGSIMASIFDKTFTRRITCIKSITLKVIFA
jgi:hypothetical protein